MTEKDSGERAPKGPLIPVCAIGASAGGVKALQQFFSLIGDDLGLAYVVIMHLSPEHESQLSAILSGCTRMPVHEVTDSPRLARNCVYVIAPDQELVIEGNTIRSRPFSEPRGQRAPIDMFFRSIAAGRGDGLAVVMSGAGTDGSLGVRKVKEAGGVIFVQEPSEAEFGMMPRSAIATGAADFVEPIDRMVERIAEVTRSKDALRRIGEEQAEEDLRQIVGFLRTRTGHDFSSYKRATVMRRVTRRMQVTRKDSLAAYAEFLKQNPEEAQDLFSDMLISVTAFFRDPEAFDTMAKQVLAALFDKPSDEKLRVWSVGCATGEEAYSLAILFLEEAERRQIHPRIQIFASDLDDGALATAREGRYPKAIEADVSELRLRRFFVDEGTHYRIRKEVRDLVLFAHHSAVKDPPFMRLDLVTCRNLLIYLERDLQRQLLGLFHYALNPGGHLFLGSAESVDTRAELFAASDHEARLFVAKPRATRGLELVTPLTRDPRFTAPSLVRAARRGVTALPQLHGAALEDMAPPSVLVDEESRILNLSKNAGRFIRPPEGPLSAIVSDLVLPELRAELRRALHRVFEAGEATLTLPVSTRMDTGARRIVMHVAPAGGDERTAPRALVLFIDTGPAQAATGSDRKDGDTPDSGGMGRIEEELRETQENLSASRREHESAIQELRVANEELQSINEEYRSTAEELETSKEELQSMNEELSTVNNELKSKLDAISSAHNDLQNLINATEIGTLFLDAQLRIKMLTPAVEQLFNVTDSDIGRPITDFTHKLAYDGIEADAAKVLRTLAPIESEVATRDKRWLMMRLRPYRTVEDRIEGVVLSFVDITGRREAETELAASEARYRRLFEAMDEGYLLAEIVRDEAGEAVDLRCGDVNPAALRLMRRDDCGSSLTQVLPGLAAGWLDLAVKVAKSGEHLRREVWAEELESWFDVAVSPIEEAQVAILFQDITERKRSADERDRMVGELNHRVKNMLAVVRSIAQQTWRSTDDPEGFIDAFGRRIDALAAAHSLLTQEQWKGADLRGLVETVIGGFADGAGRAVAIDGPPIRLSPKAAVALSMALHELATNAVKYGALSQKSGHVNATWRIDRGTKAARLDFVWQERDGPEVVPPVRTGFGRRMLESGIGYELGGDAHLDYAATGLVYRVSVPLDGAVKDGSG